MFIFINIRLWNDRKEFIASITKAEELHLAPTPYDIYMLGLLYNHDLRTGMGRESAYTELLKNLKKQN